MKVIEKTISVNGKQTNYKFDNGFYGFLTTLFYLIIFSIVLSIIWNGAKYLKHNVIFKEFYICEKCKEEFTEKEKYEKHKEKCKEEPDS